MVTSRLGKNLIETCFISVMSLKTLLNRRMVEAEVEYKAEVEEDLELEGLVSFCKLFAMYSVLNNTYLLTN